MFSSISSAGLSWPVLPSFGKYLTLTVLGLLLSAEVAWAQQPASELGMWPPGALTLLVGLWLASRNGLHRNYDTSFPLCLVGSMTSFPKFTRLLWPQHTGTSVTSLVLSYLEWNGHPRDLEHFMKSGVVWRWDILTVYHIGDKPYEQKFIRKDGTYQLKFQSPILCNLEFILKFTATADFEFDQATKDLFVSLFHPTYGTKNQRGADTFLLYWRSLRSFEQSGKLFQASYEEYNVGMIWAQVKEYSGKLARVPEGDWEGKTDKLRLYMDNSANLELEDEAAPGSRFLDDTICAGQLVSLLIYVQHFPDSRDVNPLIPLLWEWTQAYEGQSKNDNFFFDLRPHKKQQNRTDMDTPSTRDQTTDTHALNSYIIDLSADGPVTIEGEGVFGSQRYAWFWSTFSGMTITFFATLSGLANPSLATAIGLSLLRPYSNDNNWKDAGSPVSWNGRRRVRWGTGQTCGIFSGEVKPKMGGAGNSWPRASILLMTSWVTWYFRSELRRLLKFKTPECTSLWVMWAAVGLELFALSWVSIQCIILYKHIASKRVAAVSLVSAVHMGTIVQLMVMVIRSADAKHVQLLFWVAEAFTLMASVASAQAMIGVGREFMYIHHGVMLLWCHMVASSCFQYLRGISLVGNGTCKGRWRGSG